MKSRWLVRSLVILTALLCLGTAGYAGQVWWARQNVLHEIVNMNFKMNAEEEANWDGSVEAQQQATARVLSLEIQFWQECPFYGRWYGSQWYPRRTHFEVLRCITGLDLPNDPSAWESWFKAHPNLVWEEKRKRLVEAPATGEKQ